MFKVIFTGRLISASDKSGVVGLLQQQPQKQAELNRFLAQVERKACRMADIAVGNRDDALDIVQETMISLVKNYANKPEDEWPKLFFKILHNRINDHYRRQTVRNKVIGVVQFFRGKEGEPEESNTIEQAAGRASAEPDSQMHFDNVSEQMDSALKQLSVKQLQAFFMRSWQGLSVKETAVAMGCGEGSVKTHHSRAVQRLKELLAEFES